MFTLLNKLINLLPNNTNCLESFDITGMAADSPYCINVKLISPTHYGDEIQIRLKTKYGNVSEQLIAACREIAVRESEFYRKSNKELGINLLTF